jgi:GntR family transcriptional regulator, rspAB operon transcriptional repressor
MAQLERINSRPESLSERVYDTIREAIVSQKLSPGDRIVEATLAQQLGVSKTPVREALLRLMHIGLVESDGNRGGRVAASSRETVWAAYEFRTALEVQSARIVAARSPAEGVAPFRGYASRCLQRAEAGDDNGFRTFDRKFHLTLAEATGNSLLKRFVRDSFDLTWALRRRDVPAANDSLECARQHLQVVQAIDDGDVERAGSAMRQHIEKVQALVVAAFDDLPTSQGSGVLA